MEIVTLIVFFSLVGALVYRAWPYLNVSNAWYMIASMFIGLLMGDYFSGTQFAVI